MKAPSARATLFLFLLLPLAALSMALCASPLKYSFCEEVCRTINQGMTKAQVIALLRGPPGDYTTLPCVWPWPGIGYNSHDFWKSDTGIIAVRFGSTGQVEEVCFFGVMAVPEPT
jgi:hypothetical protein